jgi:hypothetical protein
MPRAQQQLLQQARQVFSGWFFRKEFTYECCRKAGGW